MKQRYLTIFVSIFFLMTISGTTFATKILEKQSECPICGSDNEYLSYASLPFIGRDMVSFIRPDRIFLPGIYEIPNY